MAATLSMNIYGYRIALEDRGNSKLPKLRDYVEEMFGTDLANMQFPALLLLHPLEDSDVKTLGKHFSEKIVAGQLAILVIGTNPIPRPVEVTTPSVHFLSYGIPTPCDDDVIVARFISLIERARDEASWDATKLGELWSVVEQASEIDALVAWYLIELAAQERVQVDPDALPGLRNQAEAQFRSLMGGKCEFDLEGVKVALQQLTARGHL
jgi:hypothetical protein